MEIAVLDLGSTTFHLQHIRVDEVGRFTTSLDEKRSLCIGTQVFSDGFIDGTTWSESLTAVWELLEASDAKQPDHRVVVATSAIRSAANGSDLIREIERTHGVAVRTLSPHEEARLAYLGQSTSDAVGGRRVAAVDLGGGSVEIAVGEGTRCIHAASLPVGALRVRAQGASAFGREEARRAAVRVRELVAGALLDIRTLSPEIVCFGSGGARAARKLLMRETPRPGKTGPIETASFRAQLNAHLGYTAKQLIDLEVDPARADSVLAAATIMLEIMDGLCVPHAFVSDKGLRDGAALELYRDLLTRGAKSIQAPAVA
jgi:exopolyphosphatase/guanosine-5'-triphosphate,3'-diphosphate pyrophosphatase